MVSSRLLLCLLLASPQTSTPPAGGTEPSVFGVTADLVVIDLIVTEGEGRLVTDLARGEIEIYEEGKRQDVVFARLMERGGLGRPPSSPTSPGGEPSVRPPADAVSSDGPPSLVVVIDLLTMPFDAVARTREAIVAMARGELEPGTRLMLVALNRNLQIRQPLTQNVERFVAAAQALPPPAGEGEAVLSTLIDELEEACAALRGTPAEGTPAGLQSPIMVSRAWIENTRLGMTAALGGMGALARYLAALPGRKHVVFYSDGYPMDPSATALTLMEGLCQPSAGLDARQAIMEMQSSVRSGQQIDSTGMLLGLLDEANRAQVSVYTVDARGLVGDLVAPGSRVPGRLSRGGTPAALAAQRTSLNTNELARGMRAAAADAHGYYLLAYAPPGGRKDGRFYRVEVKLSRPGLHLRYRRGYEWQSEAKRADRALSAALRFPELYADPGFALEASLEGSKLRVAAILSTATLAFRQEGGEYRNEITLQALLRDEKGKLVGSRYFFTKTISMKLPEGRYADLRSRDNIEIANQAEAPPRGRYQLVLVARHSGGRLAYAAADVVVP